MNEHGVSRVSSLKQALASSHLRCFVHFIFSSVRFNLQLYCRALNASYRDFFYFKYSYRVVLVIPSDLATLAFDSPSAMRFFIAST